MRGRKREEKEQSRDSSSHSVPSLVLALHQMWPSRDSKGLNLGKVMAVIYLGLYEVPSADSS